MVLVTTEWKGTVEVVPVVETDVGNDLAGDVGVGLVVVWIAKGVHRSVVEENDGGEFKFESVVFVVPVDLTDTT